MQDTAPYKPGPNKAVVLLSGGLDSATTAAIARDEGYAVHALSFRYGQRHAVELHAAAKVAASLGIRDHRIIEIDLRAFGGSALTDDIAVPKDGPAEAETMIPVTYVPARNTVFLSFALAMAESLGAQDIFIGVNAVDYSGYPDCRPAFIGAFETLAGLATAAGVRDQRPYRVHTPLIALTKAQIIRKGHSLGIDFADTLSCYDPDDTGAACGACDSCHYRAQGFDEAGLPDPTRYR
ncbi:MAG: 7-cyano-7-deazaguanine synthase QueC [Rhodothalassiaceae bacterium]